MYLSAPGRELPSGLRPGFGTATFLSYLCSTTFVGNPFLPETRPVAPCDSFQADFIETFCRIPVRCGRICGDIASLRAASARDLAVRFLKFCLYGKSTTFEPESPTGGPASGRPPDAGARFATGDHLRLFSSGPLRRLRRGGRQASLRSEPRLRTAGRSSSSPRISCHGSPLPRTGRPGCPLRRGVRPRHRVVSVPFSPDPLLRPLRADPRLPGGRTPSP